MILIEQYNYFKFLQTIQNETIVLLFESFVGIDLLFET